MSERAIEQEIDTELQALLDELVELRGKKARHDNVFHEGAMSPSMKECAGCRENRVARRYADLISARGDTRPIVRKQEDESTQRVSRRDMVMRELRHRREVEADG